MRSAGRRQPWKERLGKAHGLTRSRTDDARGDAAICVVQHVQDFHEDRHAPGSHVEGPLGANIEPRVRGKPHGIAQGTPAKNEE